MFVLNKLNRYIIDKHIPVSDLFSKYQSNYINCLERGFLSITNLTTDEITNKYRICVDIDDHDITYILKNSLSELKFRLEIKHFGHQARVITNPEFRFMLKPQIRLKDPTECIYYINRLRHRLYNYRCGIFRNLRITKFILSEHQFLRHYFYKFDTKQNYKFDLTQNYKLHSICIKPNQIYDDIKLYYTNNIITKIKIFKDNKQFRKYSIN
jgi:hypothetical protein